MRKSSSCRSNHSVFGVIRKLYQIVREWCWFHAAILDTFWVIQVLNMEIYIYVRAWPMDLKIGPSFSQLMGPQAHHPLWQSEALTLVDHSGSPEKQKNSPSILAHFNLFSVLFCGPFVQNLVWIVRNSRGAFIQTGAFIQHDMVFVSSQCSSGTIWYLRN